jgi:hypothetical protein
MSQTLIGRFMRVWHAVAAQADVPFDTRVTPYATCQTLIGRFMHF